MGIHYDAHNDGLLSRIEDAWDCVLGFLWWCLGYVYGLFSSFHR
jgi:hypothetical protein